jgi:hypothetical protein
VETNGPREGWLRRHRALVTGVTVAVVLVTAGAWAFERESHEHARKLDEAQARAERAEKAQAVATTAAREASMKQARRAEENLIRAEKAEKEAKANAARAEELLVLLLGKSLPFFKDSREPRPDDK